MDDAPLDLGSGIFVTPTGQVIVPGAAAVGPMRIPDKHGYFGEGEPAPATPQAANAAELPFELTSPPR